MNKQTDILNIGIDCSRIAPINRTGIENYAYYIVQNLAKIDHINNYRLFLKHIISLDFEKELTLGNSNFHIVYPSKTISWTQKGLAEELFKNPVDILFSPFHTIPIIRHKDQKTISMIHGLEYTFSKNYENPFKKHHIEMPIKFTCKNSDYLITPSEFTKLKILEKKWIKNENKIKVIQEGVNNNFYKRSQQEIQNVKNKYNLNSPYIVFVSTIQPRKNLERLIEAFAQLLKESNHNIDLVISGKPGWNYEKVFNAPKRLNIENQVKFIGRTSDVELPALLSGAQAYINPSLEEGFGLPVLEAMACETVCILSDIPPFKEVAKDNAIYFNPLNIEDIKQKLECAIGSQIDNTHMISKAKHIANTLTWEKTAAETLSFFEDIIKNV